MGRPPPAKGTSAVERRFTVVYEEHYGAILAYFLRRVGSPADAADAAAETFAIAWRRSDRLPTDDPRPWLYGVARRVLSNHRRAHRRRSSLDDRLRQTTPAPDDHDGASAEVLDALDRLSEGDRELLTLVAWDGLAPREIARALDVPASVISVRLHRARRRLGAQLNVGRRERPATPLASEKSL